MGNISQGLKNRPHWDLRPRSVPGVKATLGSMRFAAALLSLSLIGTSMPLDASAQVVRVAVGEAGIAPVAPVGNSISGSNLAPNLSIGAATLTGGLSAPSIAPAPSALNGAVSVKAVPSALAPVLSAPSTEQPEKPETPKQAATPVAPAKAKKWWNTPITELLGLKKPAEAKSEQKTTTAETASVEGAVQFDGVSEKKGSVEGAPVVEGDNSKAFKAGQKLGKFVRQQNVKRNASVDEFGGPLSEPMTFKQRVGYGLSRGLHMIGIGAIMTVGLKPLLDAWAWPSIISDSALQGFGRVALLTKFGPNEIVEGLANNPIGFMGFSLPWAVTMEEISFRLLGFGLTFLVIAAVRPFSRWVSKMISGLPDAAGAVTGVQRFLKLGDVTSRYAFPIAAIYSSFQFAVAHFGAWGVDPYILLVNGVLGVFLAHTAYKSRSIVAPIVAHLLFNLSVFAVILAGIVWSPATALMIAIVMGLLGSASLLYSWLMARKIKKFQINGAMSIVALALAGSLLTGVNPPSKGDLARAFNSHSTRGDITLVQEAVKPGAAVGAAVSAGGVAPDSTKAAVAPVIEPREVMTARVKGAVVNVIVRMPQGMGTGSGFIITPDGMFISNAHVTGTRKPGEFVEARIPGVNGIVRAKVLAANHDKDIAILQLAPRMDGKPWPTVPLAKNPPLEGEQVTAMGYPRGLPFTVTAGVMSGLEGRGNMYVQHLQTDASINPGNSGGPLFNAAGEVVGMNTQIFTMSGGSDGLGFSITAPAIQMAIDQYLKTGNMATASLGIIANLSDPNKPEAGLEIEYVKSGSAAEAAGLKRGDLIVAVGDMPIMEGGQEAALKIALALSRHTPGEQVDVTVLRADEKHVIKVKVDAKVTGESR